MMERQSRPSGEPGTAKASIAGDSAIVADLDELAANLRGYLVLQVVVNDEGDRRTTIYRSAGAAERAVKRARSRGRDAHVTLCQLLPVGVVLGGGGCDE